MTVDHLYSGRLEQQAGQQDRRRCVAAATNALKGDDRSAMAVIKMAMQMGFLEDADSNPAEATALSASDEQILEELLTRRR